MSKQIFTCNSTSQINYVKWSDFISHNQQGSFFHTPEACTLYQSMGKPGIVALLDEAGNIHGLCVFLNQRYGPAILGSIFTRTLIYGNLPVLNNDKTLTANMLQSLTRLNKNSVYIELRNFYPDNLFELFQGFGFKYHPHLNIINNLEGTVNELFDMLSSSRKRGIKKAMKHNFNFACIQNPSDKVLLEGYELIKSTYKRIKLPFPASKSFHFINKQLPQDSRLFFVLQDEDNNLCAFLVGFVFKKTFYGYYVGSKNDSDFLNKRPLDLFYWEVLKYLNKEGYQKFDWMGAGSLIP